MNLRESAYLLKMHDEYYIKKEAPKTVFLELPEEAMKATTYLKKKDFRNAYEIF